MSDVVFVGYQDNEGNKFPGNFQYDGAVGPIGPAGYTPQKGIDYFTEQDIDEILTDVKGLNDLTYYTLATDTGSIIELAIDNTTYVTTVNLKNSDGTTISTSSIDLPLESMIINCTYDSSTKELVITLQSGSVVRVSIADVISGLVPDSRTIAGIDLADNITKSEMQTALDFDTKQDVIDSSHKISADYVDDTSTTNKFVTSSDITKWNNTSSQMFYSYLTSDIVLASNVAYPSLSKGYYFTNGHHVIVNGTTCEAFDNSIIYFNNKPSSDGSFTAVYKLEDTRKLPYYRYYRVDGFVLIGAQSFTVSYSDLLTQEHIDTTLDSFAEDTKVPSSKCVYDELETLKQENAKLLDQIPTYTATGTTINVKDSSNLPIKDFALLGNASQDGTPTPGSPVPIQVVTGDNTLEIVGKNMLNITTLTDSNKWTYSSGLPYDVTYASRITINSYDSNNMNFTINTNHYLMLFIDEIKLKLNTQYTISYKRTDSISGKQKNYIWTKENTTYTQVATSTTDTTNISMTFTTSSSGIIAFGIGVNNTAEDDVVDVKNIQLEVGSTATTYESYTEQTQLISLGDIELAKIGTYQDRIYKDNGKWYLEKWFEKKVFNGTENWGIDSSGTANWILKSTIGNFECNNLVNNEDRILGNLYSATIPNITTSNTVEGINAYHNSATSTQLRLRYGTEPTSTDDFKTFLASNNLITYTLRKTPTYTEITDTTLIQQLENVLAMSTYQNETNAFSIVASGNEEANLQIEYRQDLQTLTDKIDSLEARVTLLET